VLSALPRWRPGPGAYTCDHGAIPGRTYSSTVTGSCFFGGAVVVNGNVTVKDGAALNDHAFSYATHVTINGHVKVGRGAVLGLGTYNPEAIHDTTVNGNIIANHPKTLYLSFTTVHGNVVSKGGGSVTEFRSFPTKDNTIDGELDYPGMAWRVARRDSQHGRRERDRVEEAGVSWSWHIRSLRSAAIQKRAPALVPCRSSTTIRQRSRTNTVHGNLIWQGNTPTAQVNPADFGGSNSVDGKAIGQCADLVDTQS